MSSKISQLTPDVKGSIVPSLIVELNEVKTLTNVNLKEIYFCTCSFNTDQKTTDN